MAERETAPDRPRGGPGLLAWLGLALLAAGRSGSPEAVAGERAYPSRRRGARRGVRRPRLSWGAAVAGAILSAALLLLFGALGAGLMLLPEREAAWLLGSPTLTGAAALVACALALGLGGFVAARWAATGRAADGALHGALAWALVCVVAGGLAIGSAARAGDRATVIASAAIVSAADVAASATEALGRIAATGVDEVPVPIATEGAASEAADLLRQATRTPERTLDDLARALTAAREAVADPEPSAPRGVLPGATDAVPDEETLTTLIAQQTGVSPERAAEGVADWRARAAPDASLPELLQERAGALGDAARDAAARSVEPVLRAASVGLLAGAVLLLVGALAAVLGGALAGAREPRA